VSTTKSFAGQSFNLPANREPKSSNWGTHVSNFLIAVADNALAKTGGTFTLSAEMSFGATYGLLLPYIKSASANISSTGIVRFANNEGLGWRNAANNADLILKVNASNALEFNGNPITALALGAANTVLKVNSGGTATEYGKITTNNIDASAAIVDTQLATISTAGKVSNSATTAASANTASAIVARDSNGDFSAGTITANLSGNASTVTTNANLTGPVTSVGNATAIADGALALAKLATTTAGYIPVGAATTGVPTYVAMSGDATLASTGVLTLATVPASKGGTGVANNVAATTTRVGNYAKTETLTNTTSVTYPTSGTLATLAGTETFTAKTLTSPTIDDYFLINEESAPSTPASGKVAVYAKTDKKIYTKNSDGTETEIGSGSGSGEKNYITNSSALTAITGWTSVGDLDVARTITAGDLPREFTTAAGIKITADSNTQSVADYVYYDFSLDDVDLSKKLGIKWSQKTTGTYTAGDLAVVITSQADRTTALHTPITTAIPSATGVFTTSFEATTTAALSLVIRATTDMTTDGGIVISDVVVGPGIQPQGVVVGEWQTKTVPITWNQNVTTTAKGRRVGDSLELYVQVACTGAPHVSDTALYFTLPDSLTIDTTKLVTSTNDFGNMGDVHVVDGGTQYYYGKAFYRNTTQIQVIMQRSDGTYVNGTTGLSSGSTPIVFGNTDYVWFRSKPIPIAEWAGSGTVNLAQNNDVEYAFNTSTDTTGSDTNSFGYGPGGVPFYSVTAAGSRRVQFQTPIQATDKIELEYLSGTTWLPLTMTDFNIDISPIEAQNSVEYGLGISRVSGSSTQVDVRYGTYSWANGATFGATGKAWSAGPVASSSRWRVKKSSGGQAVGFGLSDSTSSGLAPSGVFRNGEQGNLALQERTATPADPTSSSEAKIYLKADKLILQFNDAGTVRYKYLDLTGTGVTWVHTTSAP
jgi:hypothetical protein